MAENTKIGWTHHTMNFWWGCNKVSRRVRATATSSGIMRRAGKRALPRADADQRDLGDPPRWDRSAPRGGAERHRVFTCSMSDFFHPGADPWRGEAWEIIRGLYEPRLAGPDQAARADPATGCPPDWGEATRTSGWGSPAASADSLDRLRTSAIPAAVKFVSAEPLLERIDFRPHLDGSTGSSPAASRPAKGKRRPMDLDWVRDIDHQCREAGVAHFFKQSTKGLESPTTGCSIASSDNRGRGSTDRGSEEGWFAVMTNTRPCSPNGSSKASSLGRRRRSPGYPTYRRSRPSGSGIPASQGGN